MKNIAYQLSFDVYKIDFDIPYINHKGRDSFDNIVPRSQYSQFPLFQYIELPQMRARADFSKQAVLEVANIEDDGSFFSYGDGGDEAVLFYENDPSARMHYADNAIEWNWPSENPDAEFENHSSYRP